MARTKRVCFSRFINDRTLEEEYNEITDALNNYYLGQWALRKLKGKTSLEEWKKYQKSYRVSENGNGTGRFYRRGFCGGPVHPLTGKVYGWDDELPRDRESLRITNRRR